MCRSLISKEDMSTFYGGMINSQIPDLFIGICLNGTLLDFWHLREKKLKKKSVCWTEDIDNKIQKVFCFFDPQVL